MGFGTNYNKSCLQIFMIKQYIYKIFHIITQLLIR